MCALHASMRLQCHFKLSSLSCGTRTPLEYFPVAFLYSPSTVALFSFVPSHNREILPAPRSETNEMQLLRYLWSQDEESDDERVRNRKRIFRQNRLKCILCLCWWKILLCVLRNAVFGTNTLAIILLVSVSQFSQFFLLLDNLSFSIDTFFHSKFSWQWHEEHI